jgi:hypothetical protein
MSIIERFLVLADPSGPFIRTDGPRRVREELISESRIPLGKTETAERNDSHRLAQAAPMDSSNGRDSGLALARPVQYVFSRRAWDRSVLPGDRRSLARNAHEKLLYIA